AETARSRVTEAPPPAQTTTRSAVAGGMSAVRNRKRAGPEGIAPYHRAMSPDPRRRSGAPARRLAALLAAAAAVLVGCASFDPAGPCNADGKVPGAYPDLEAVVPKSFQARPPAELDSGRTCTSSGLGSLATHGVKELRFAGGT